MRVGVAGFGTVGMGVAKLLLDPENRFGFVKNRPELAAVADIDWETEREVTLPKTVRREDDAVALAKAEDIDAVVELIGGTGAAFDVIMAAVDAGKPVVTANKALLAERGREIFAPAREKGVSIGFEASVCGGIPLLRSIRAGLAADRIESFKGILNGTCNFILSRMYRDAAGYKSALTLAQEQGYAEADPTLDVSGTDSAHKLVLLAGLAFGAMPSMKDVDVEGIDGLDSRDVVYGRDLGYVTKLIASGRRRGAGAMELSVHPTLLPAAHPLAAVSGAYNAVWVDSDAVGTTMYYGPGAGMMPTASAVVSDLLDVASGSAMIEFERLGFIGAEPAQTVSLSSTDSRFYMRFTVKDEFGVLGKIAGMLGKHRVSIASVVQKASSDPTSVPIVMLTHTAREKDAATALARIDEEEFVTAPTAVLRIDDEENLL
ncbi:MAG: homoserine dehydrogenase [Planctomycetes bacterium]|nr:homoserine dehydrogenase [Planctomycetota bacterium]